MTLSKQQLAGLKELLDSRCLSLAAEVHADEARARDNRAGDPAGARKDSGEAAVTNQITDLDNAELARDLHELREMQAARARFDAGSFGQCIDCQKEIGYPRLHVQPAALRCLNCQLIHERSLAHPATPKL